MTRYYIIYCTVNFKVASNFIKPAVLPDLKNLKSSF